MLRPEWVSLVYPPSTIIPNTPAAVKNSQPPTIFSLPYLTKWVVKLKRFGVVNSLWKGLLKNFLFIFLVNIMIIER